MPRKPKYPDAETTIQSFFKSVSESYQHPGKDEIGDVPGRKKQELLAEEFRISRLKVRKILITAKDITYLPTDDTNTGGAEGKCEDRCSMWSITDQPEHSEFLSTIF